MITADVPNGWKVVAFGETCTDLYSGGTPPTRKPEYWNGDIPWTTSAYLDALYLRTAPKRISEAGLESSASRLVPAGNLLVGTRVGVGKAAVNLLDVAISQDLTAAIVDRSRFVPEYLALHLRSSRCQDFFQAGKRGATIKGIPRDDLYRLPIAAPQLAEQRAIADVLLTIEAAVDTQARAVQGLKELKAATMAKLFHEGLRGEPLKQTEIGEIPRSWEVVQLRQVALVERGKFAHRPRNDPRFYGGTTPFIQTGDVARSGGSIRTYDQTLNERGLEVSRVFPMGTIVLTIAANIADTGILEFDSAFPDSLVGITPDESIDARFLELYLRTQKAEMNRLAPKGTQRNINIQFLAPWPTPRPPLEDQRDIARWIKTVDDRLLTAEARYARLRNLFSSVLHRLMTGQVRVPPSLIDERLGARPSLKPEQAVLDEIVRRVVAAVAPEKIILFGSAARGEMGPDSDLDLLVVKACDDRREIARTVRACLRGVAPGRGKDVVVVTPEDVERDRDTIGYIIRPALREGRVLYAA